MPRPIRTPATRGSRRAAERAARRPFQPRRSAANSASLTSAGGQSLVRPRSAETRAAADWPTAGVATQLLRQRPQRAVAQLVGRRLHGRQLRPAAVTSL